MMGPCSYPPPINFTGIPVKLKKTHRETCVGFNTCVLGISVFSLHLAGEQRSLRNLIGSSISEYPALLTSERNKMACHFVLDFSCGRELF